MRNNFYEDEKALLECYVNSTLVNPKFKYRNFMATLGTPNEPNITPRVELIVKPECNQNCEYCYIARHGAHLYPYDERVSNEQILKNLKSLLDYVYIEHELLVTDWELFAGDLFFDDLYFDIVEMFYGYLAPLYKKYRPVMDKHETLILIPCNFSFIVNDEKVKKLQEYIDKFQAIGCDLGFSCSSDGIYATDTREGKELDEAYYEKIFKLKQRNPAFGFHPMIAPSNVKNAIKNYDWWYDMYQKHVIGKINGRQDFLPMFLEVRNDEWTEENIDQLIDLLQHMIDHRLQLCDNDIDKFAYHLFNGDGSNETLPKLGVNDLIMFRYKSTLQEKQRISCSMHHILHITLNNFNLVPCHRLTYKQFVGGHFTTNSDGKINGVEPHNVSGFLGIKFYPADETVKCFNCVLQPICQQGCLGAQFESSGELFEPCLSVCDMQQRKYFFLLRTYNKMGVFKSAKEQDLLLPDELKYLQAALKSIGEEAF